MMFGTGAVLFLDLIPMILTSYLVVFAREVPIRLYIRTSSVGFNTDAMTIEIIK